MSYTPNEWDSGDVVTAVKMNALETAVGDMNMSYTPNTWSDGDILTASKMNALEQAVASGGGGGSSDFSTAEVTLIHNGAGMDPVDYMCASINEENTFDEVSPNVTLSGACEWFYEGATLLVTGDCTITIS